VDKNQDAKIFVSDLLRGQKTGVLATCSNNIPHLSVVGFAFSPDLKRIFFATPFATIKFKNIQQNPSVELLLDNRKNIADDFSNAVACACAGRAAEVSGDSRNFAHQLMLEKHPELVDFLRSPTCSIIEIRIFRYSLVKRFQEVTDLFMEEPE
jgi:uncharacterized pyridoxamine 5'-phosphate oxidase family protein